MKDQHRRTDSGESTASLQTIHSGYGAADAPLLFSDFGQSTIPTTGKLFTSEFAKRTYHALHAASTEEGNRAPLSLFQKECLWMRSKMESLAISDNAAISTFISELRGVVMTIEKNILSNQTQVSQARNLFKVLVNQLLLDIQLFIMQRRPDLKLPTEASNPEINLDTRVEECDYVNYSKTELPADENLFSATFAKSIYEIIMQDATAKTVLELAAVFNQLSTMQYSLRDKVFQAAITIILTNIQQYILSTHPEIPDRIAKNINQAKASCEDNNATNCVECCWMMLCIPNAAVQVPTLSLLGFSIQFLLHFISCGLFVRDSVDCLPLLKKEDQLACGNTAYCILPYERAAIAENKSGFFTPLSSIYRSYNLCSDASAAASVAYKQYNELYAAHSLLPSTPLMR